jgi:hypothetical protein
MRFRKLIALGFVGVMLVSGVSACGDDDDDTGDDTIEDSGDDAGADNRADMIEGLMEGGATEEQANCTADYFEENSEEGFAGEPNADGNAEIIAAGAVECGVEL